MTKLGEGVITVFRVWSIDACYDRGSIFWPKNSTPRTDQIDHDLDHLDHVVRSLPLLDVVQDVYTDQVVHI